ncbi:MAG TPA: hypothetical protein VEA59_02295, partial [Patescibacteria group bacterium]|nr:hypothetical protein [Patescibacteria group bacterium]
EGDYVSLFLTSMTQPGRVIALLAFMRDEDRVGSWRLYVDKGFVNADLEDNIEKPLLVALRNKLAVRLRSGQDYTFIPQGGTEFSYWQGKFNKKMPYIQEAQGGR